MARNFIAAAVSDTLIIQALNTPGRGGVAKWRDNMMDDLLRVARVLAPRGKVGNALHRGGGGGAYLAGLRTDRRGSNGHWVRGNLRATAPHSRFVEYGRWPYGVGTAPRAPKWGVGTPGKPGIYSWVGFIGRYGDPGPRFAGSRGYKGKHVLRNAFDFVATDRNIHANATKTGL